MVQCLETSLVTVATHCFQQAVAEDEAFAVVTRISSEPAVWINLKQVQTERPVLI